MKTEERRVADQDGAEITAQFVICEECGNDAFLLFLIGPHNLSHLQCIECGTSYCDGHEDCGGGA